MPNCDNIYFRSNSIEDPLIERIPLDLPGLSSANAFPLDLPLSSNILPHSDVPTTEVKFQDNIFLLYLFTWCINKALAVLFYQQILGRQFKKPT